MTNILCTALLQLLHRLESWYNNTNTVAFQPAILPFLSLEMSGEQESHETTAIKYKLIVLRRGKK